MLTLCCQQWKGDIMNETEKQTDMNNAEILYQLCEIKDKCTLKNCMECVYKNEGKKYYIGGQ